MSARLFTSALLLLALPLSGAVAQDNIGCGYRDKSLEGTYIRSDQCGLVSETIVYLDPELLEKVYFDTDGVSCVWFGQEHRFWIRRDGKFMRVPNWGGDCAIFQQGLAVAQLQDRPAFIDKSLQVVLEPGFEFLGAFEDGYATVCNGPFEHERFGEKTRVTGGACAMIDASGRLVMDLVHPREDFEAFRDFRNANNHCPPPPIEDESAALCHARRHAMRQDWTSHSVERVNDRWEFLYSFLNSGAFLNSIRERTNLIELGREKADVRWHGREDLRRR